MQGNVAIVVGEVEARHGGGGVLDVTEIVGGGCVE